MSVRRVLVTLNDDLSTGAARAKVSAWAKIMLERWGYTVDYTVLRTEGSTLANFRAYSDYEFIVLLRPTNFSVASGESHEIITGDHCPVFIIGMDQAGTFTTAYFGVTRDSTAAYVDATWEGISETIPVYVCTYVDANTAGLDIEPIAALTSDATKMIAWKMTSGVHPVYTEASAGGENSAQSLFPLLLQTAINDGAISAPTRKIINCFDLDDFPNPNGTATTVASAEAIAEDCISGQIKLTIGVHASKTIDGHNELADVWEPSGVNAVLRQYQVRNGGPWYPIEHMGNTYWSTVEISGSPAGGQTKADIDTFYRDHVDNMHDHGIYQGWNNDGLDSYGYHYFNTNRLDDKGLQLATPRTLKVADPADTTAMAGYGWKVARMDDNAAQRVIGLTAIQPLTARQNTGFYGIMIVDSTSPFNSTDESVAYASNLSTYAINIMGYLNSFVRSSILYMHGRNAGDYLNDVSSPLKITLTKIGAINLFASDVLRCGHPSEWAPTAR